MVENGFIKESMIESNKRSNYKKLWRVNNVDYLMDSDNDSDDDF